MSEYCRDALYAIKADDDTFLNIFEMVRLMTENSHKSQVRFVFTALNIPCKHAGGADPEFRKTGFNCMSILIEISRHTFHMTHTEINSMKTNSGATKVGRLCDYELYKFKIDIDVDIVTHFSLKHFS